MFTPGAPSGERCSAVPAWKILHKSLIRPWATKNGDVLFHNAKEDDKAALQLQNVLRCVNSGNSELCHRITVGMSEHCANVTAGFVSLLKYLRPGGTAEDAGAILGTMAAQFAGADAARFLRACDILDTQSANYATTAAAAREGFVDWLQFLRTDVFAKEATLRKVALLSSRLYISSISLLEAMALANSPGAWATKFEPKTGHDWFARPDNVASLHDFFTTAFVDAASLRERRESFNLNIAIADSANTAAGNGEARTTHVQGAAEERSRGAEQQRGAPSARARGRSHNRRGAGVPTNKRASTREEAGICETPVRAHRAVRRSMRTRNPNRDILTDSETDGGARGSCCAARGRPELHSRASASSPTRGAASRMLRDAHAARQPRNRSASRARRRGNQRACIFSDTDAEPMPRDSRGARSQSDEPRRSTRTPRARD